MKKIVLLFALVIGVSGCTKNQRARQFGGTEQYTLPKNQKLVNVTWKQDSMWVLMRPIKTNEVAETYLFQEVSSFGIIEGKAIISETK